MKLLSVLAAGTALLGLGLAQGGVSPPSVAYALNPGESVLVNKTVTTLEIPPKPDIVLLVDVTGSMQGAIDNIKANLIQVISAFSADPEAQFAVAFFSVEGDPRGSFGVLQDFTSEFGLLQAAVDRLEADNGGEEEWIGALYNVAKDAVTVRRGSSRVVVLVGDEPSRDPSLGHSLEDAIQMLDNHLWRVVAIKLGQGRNLDTQGQATAVVDATQGKMVGSSPDEVTNAIIEGLSNLDVTVRPVASCDDGLEATFSPSSVQVPSGAIVEFVEEISVLDDADFHSTQSCSVDFLLNETPGGAAFVQHVTVEVGVGCDTCDPRPGHNECDITTSCTETPAGHMCLTRPGYKADGADDTDTEMQWRLVWPTPFHDHRVAVKPGTKSTTLCSSEHVGRNVCAEVLVASCPAADSAAKLAGNPAQKVMGTGQELRREELR